MDDPGPHKEKVRKREAGSLQPWVIEGDAERSRIATAHSVHVLLKSMLPADGARTAPSMRLPWPREVEDTNNPSTYTMSLLEDQIKQTSFVILAISSHSVGTDICYLDHAGQGAVDEEGGFN